MDLMDVGVIVVTLGISIFYIKKQRKKVQEFLLIEEEDLEKQTLEMTIKNYQKNIDHINFEIQLLQKENEFIKTDMDGIKIQYQNLKDDFIKYQDNLNKNCVEHIRLEEQKKTVANFIANIKTDILSKKTITESFEKSMINMAKNLANI